jgi:hypothetical protein
VSGRAANGLPGIPGFGQYGELGWLAPVLKGPDHGDKIQNIHICD